MIILPNKPVIALFTPHTLVKILAPARDRHFNIVEYSRFVLDEIHERSVDIDVLVALLTKKLNYQTLKCFQFMTSRNYD